MLPSAVSPQQQHRHVVDPLPRGRTAVHEGVGQLVQRQVPGLGEPPPELGERSGPPARSSTRTRPSQQRRRMPRPGHHGPPALRIQP